MSGVPAHLLVTAAEVQSQARRLLGEVVTLVEAFELAAWEETDLGEEVEGTPEQQRVVEGLGVAHDALIVMASLMSGAVRSRLNPAGAEVVAAELGLDPDLVRRLAEADLERDRAMLRLGREFGPS